MASSANFVKTCQESFNIKEIIVLSKKAYSGKTCFYDAHIWDKRSIYLHDTSWSLVSSHIWLQNILNFFLKYFFLFKVKNIFLYPTCVLDLLPGAKQKWSCLMKELLPSFSFFYQNMKEPPSSKQFWKNWFSIFSFFSSYFLLRALHWLGQEKSGEKLPKEKSEVKLEAYVNFKAKVMSRVKRNLH